MILAFFVLSLGGSVAALLVPGWSDLLLIAGPVGLACLWVLLRRGRGPARTVAVVRPRVVIDGSNVMHWGGGTPRIETVQSVVRLAEGRGFQAGVIFDANVGYKIGTRYLDDADLAVRLGLPAEQVLVVPKGTPADDYILQSARRLGARVISADRFRDWADRYPEVASDGFVIRGGLQEGEVWLDPT